MKELDMLLSNLISKWSNWEDYADFYINELLPNLISGKDQSENTIEQELIIKIRLLVKDDIEMLVKEAKRVKDSEPIEKQLVKEAKVLLNQFDFEKANKICDALTSESRKEALLEYRSTIIDKQWQVIDRDLSFYKFDCANRLFEKIEAVCDKAEYSSRFQKYFDRWVSLTESNIENYLKEFNFKKADKLYENDKKNFPFEIYLNLVKTYKNEEVLKNKDLIVVCLKRFEFDKADKIYQKVRNVYLEDEYIELYQSYLHNYIVIIKDNIYKALSKSKYEEADKIYETIAKHFSHDEYKKIKGEYYEKNNFIEELENKLSKFNFLGADNFFKTGNSQWLSVDKYEGIKAGYITEYFKFKYPDFFSVHAEKALAIADTSKQLLLRARAGSGKTTTLSLKIAYLIGREKIKPDEIVAVCFNNKAAASIRNTLSKHFNINYKAKENITTFHSLAHQINPPGEGIDILYDDDNPFALKGLTNFIDSILEENWDKPFADLITDSIKESSPGIFGFLSNLFSKIKYFKYKLVIYAIDREDKNVSQEEIELDRRDIEYGSDEHYQFRRNLSYITLKGEHVKSQGEKYIADYLSEHGINYEYEPNFRWDNQTYHPDFKLYDYDIILEHWGIDENTQVRKVPSHWSKSWEEYYSEMQDKRAYWDNEHSGKKYQLMETSIADLKRGRKEFESCLKQRLSLQGIDNKKLPLEEIINTITSRLRERFSGKIKNYIQKAKQAKYSPSEMQKKINNSNYPKFSRVKVFLALANSIYEKYEKSKVDKIDFYDLLSQAAKTIHDKKGECILKSETNLKDIKWLLIDEFQDFSPLFLDIVKSIQKYNPELKLFCVGDDWQSINSFAGSDVELFRSFDSLFTGDTATKGLRINWRSDTKIVKFGNAVMSNFGEASLPEPGKDNEGEIIIKDINDGYIEIPIIKNKFQAIKRKVVFLRYLQFISDIIDQYWVSLKREKNFKVLILCRTKRFKNCLLNDLKKTLENGFNNIYPDESNQVASIFNNNNDPDQDQIRCITAHQSKGLEANVVIVLQSNNRSFPKIHPDILYYEIFGDSIEKTIEEERRLFYVATSRAKNYLHLLYEKDKDYKHTLSEFVPIINNIDFNINVEEIRKNYPNAYYSWTDEDMDKLKQCYNSGERDMQKLATIFKRQENGISSKLKDLYCINEEERLLINKEFKDRGKPKYLSVSI